MAKLEIALDGFPCGLGLIDCLIGLLRCFGSIGHLHAELMTLRPHRITMTYPIVSGCGGRIGGAWVLHAGWLFVIVLHPSKI